ncbi:hypothetical protein D3C71_585150 [compost metagenome]
MGITKTKAANFVDKLIDVKLLISELEPNVTKDDTSSIFSTLTLSTLKSDFSPLLQDVTQSIEPPHDIQRLSKLDDNRHQFEKLLNTSLKNIYQVDLQLSAVANQIEASLIKQISKEINEISVLNNASISADLKQFISAFHKKYEGQEIPLLEALNPEIGIGYGLSNIAIEDQYPLLKNFKPQKSASKEEHFNIAIKNILEKYPGWDIFDIPNIELNEEDLQNLSGSSEKNQNKPIGFHVLGNLLLENHNLINKANFRFNLLKVGGVSGLPLMTRFSHLDAKLKEREHAVAAFEEKQANGKILAEIVFLPNRRAGNILSRPAFYKYEIPIICQGTVENEHIINLKDLYIRVKNGVVILYSHKLQKEIIPRLSSAHNFTYGMAIYRFLCDLQPQYNGMNICWEWGTMSSRNYLPRVTYKHLILSRARWRLTQEACIRNLKTNHTEIIESIRGRYNLPNHLLLIEGDNEQFIDLESAFGRQLFLKALTKNDITVYEYIYDSFRSALKNENEEAFNNEILIPFKGEQFYSDLSLHTSSGISTVRQFLLGSEWLYFKLYSSESYADKILNGPIRALISKLFRENLILKWFFIRYNDSDPHLRIRLHLNIQGDITLSKSLQYINQYFEPLLSEKKIDKIIYDTYNRELERYGADNIENCEYIFFKQSELILELLPLFRKDSSKTYRWLTAMKVAEEMLSAFSFPPNEKLKLSQKIRDEYLDEFKNYQKLKYSLNKSFRENQRLITNFFDDQHCSTPEIFIALKKYQNVVKEFCVKCQRSAEYHRKYTEIVASLIHMFLNRIFSIKQREQELAIYHFLSKYLTASINRNRPS